MQQELAAVVASVRPALQAADTTELEHAQFLYDLVRAVYDHAKFDISGPGADTGERGWLGAVGDAANRAVLGAAQAERASDITER